MYIGLGRMEMTELGQKCKICTIYNTQYLHFITLLQAGRPYPCRTIQSPEFGLPPVGHLCSTVFCFGQCSSCAGGYHHSATICIPAPDTERTLVVLLGGVISARDRSKALVWWLRANSTSDQVRKQWKQIQVHGRGVTSTITGQQCRGRRQDNSTATDYQYKGDGVNITANDQQSKVEGVKLIAQPLTSNTKGRGLTALPLTSCTRWGLTALMMTTTEWWGGGL